MIHSPRVHTAQMVEKKAFNTYPVLNWTDLLEIPNIGARQIDKEQQKYKQEIQHSKQTIEDPQKFIGTITSIPKWIKGAIYVLIIIVVVLGIGFKIKQFLDCCFPSYRSFCQTAAHAPVTTSTTIPQTRQIDQTTAYIPIYLIITEEKEQDYHNLSTINLPKRNETKMNSHGPSKNAGDTSGKLRIQ